MTNYNDGRYKVTKEDLDRVFKGWLFASALSWNFETQQSGGITMSLTPVLRKIYKDDDQFKDALMSTYHYYNSQKTLSYLVLGSVVALEENHDRDNPELTRESVTALKTSLMGPFAGIGDSLINTIPMTIFASISSYFALEGNPIGILFGVAFGVFTWFLGRWFVNLGYRYGTNLMTTFADRVALITNAAQILGVTVIGGLVAANVNIPVSLVIKINEVELGLQSIFDSIMPKLTSVVFVGFIYWLLGKKNMTTGKIILIILGLSFVLFNLGIIS